MWSSANIGVFYEEWQVGWCERKVKTSNLTLLLSPTTITSSMLNNFFPDTPFALNSNFVMNEPNQSITIYDGVFNIKLNTKELSLRGSIKFEWTPTSKISFNDAEVTQNASFYDLDPYFGKDLQLYINGILIGKCRLTFTSGNLKSVVASGRIIGKFLLGDKTKSINYLKFTIPNLRRFDGTLLKERIGDGYCTFHGRLTLETLDHVIILDQRRNNDILQDSLQKKGGYLIFYNGEYRKKDSAQLTDLAIENFLNCLTKYLSFINGTRSSPTFIEGMNDEEVVWTDYTTYPVDGYKQVRTWSIEDNHLGLADLWKSFFDLWKEDSEFLTSVLHWYIEANSVTEYLDGNLVLVQTALELIYNWFIMEKSKLLFGSDADNINAANKLRLLLPNLNISSAIPKHFFELNEIVQRKNDLNDGPGVITYIRNCIVHSKAKNRENLKLVTDVAKMQALQLSLWYVELSILKILDYKGRYFNRCSNKPYYVDRIENIPWA